MLILLLSIILLFNSASGIKVLRNTLAIQEQDTVAGASLVNASDKVQTSDITICMKFNVKVRDSETSLCLVLLFVKNAKISVRSNVPFKIKRVILAKNGKTVLKD